jgi:hypothetical protein
MRLPDEPDIPAQINIVHAENPGETATQLRFCALDRGCSRSVPVGAAAQ